MNFIYTALAAKIPALADLAALTEGVNTIYRYSISIGGILAFGIIVFAGIEYIISAGNVARQSNAKSRIFSAILGLIILLGAVLIAQGLPGLLTFSEENLITPTPPSSATGGDKVATREDILKSYGGSGIKSNILNPEITAQLRTEINQKIDAAANDPEKLKSVLVSIQSQVFPSQRTRIFFEEIKKRGLDDDLFLAYKSVTEKATYLRLMRERGVKIAETISNPTIRANILHDDLFAIHLQTQDLIDAEKRSEFTNIFSGPKLAAVFANFYLLSGSLKNASSGDKINFVNSLNDEKIRQLYENLLSSGLQKTLKDILRFTLDRDIWRTLP
jgi:hypothetical protein